MNNINFLMAFHCHQPVDNFGFVFDEAFQKSYKPFLEILERHPDIKVSLHYSGPLFDWFRKHKPSFLDKINKLLERKQVELLSGGYFEPVLPIIPERDRVGQIKMMTDFIKRTFNYTPRGAWLTERVWDPELAGLFKGLDVKYTILDSFHLKQAGKKEDDISGYYSIKGYDDFFVFPAIKKLRYAIPFREPAVTVDFLKGALSDRGARSIAFADDGEKLGLWPHTYDWVYKKGWLERFFKALEENEWIKTMTFSEACEASGSLGELEIPHSSYSEMMHWSGGHFNNFFKKYPESDFMRKRMLNISDAVESAGRGNPAPTEAQLELYKSQSNCAYWHGVFGGVYMPFLRQGAYRHIIKAESLLKDKDNDSPVAEAVKFTDTKDDIVECRNASVNLLMDAACGASLVELDYKPASYNLVNTISRRYEPYHDMLKRRSRVDVRALKKDIEEGKSVDLHKILGIKERNLKAYLHYDPYRKVSLICHFMDKRVSLKDFTRSTHTSLAEEDLSLGKYNCTVRSAAPGKLVIDFERYGSINMSKNLYKVRFKKCLILEKDSDLFVRFELENVSDRELDFVFGVEFNWSVCDDRFMRQQRRRGIKSLELKDKYCGIGIEHTFFEPVNAWAFPMYTLNETESGLGKSFQQISLLFHKPVRLKAAGSFSLETKVAVSG